MDIHARVDDCLSTLNAPVEAQLHGGEAQFSTETLFLLMLLEYLREMLREMRQSFTDIARMESKIMFDETAIKQHVQDSSDALAAIADGVQKMRDQLAVGNDTAVQSELDRIDSLLSPVATRAKALADSFKAPEPAPAPTPEPAPAPVTDPTV